MVESLKDLKAAKIQKTNVICSIRHLRLFVIICLLIWLYVSNREHYFMTYTYSQTMSNLLVHVVIESSKVVAVPLPYFVNFFY